VCADLSSSSPMFTLQTQHNFAYIGACITTIYIYLMFILLPPSPFFNLLLYSTFPTCIFPLPNSVSLSHTHTHTHAHTHAHARTHTHNTSRYKARASNALTMREHCCSLSLSHTLLFSSFFGAATAQGNRLNSFFCLSYNSEIKGPLLSYGCC